MAVFDCLGEGLSRCSCRPQSAFELGPKQNVDTARRFGASYPVWILAFQFIGELLTVTDIQFD